MKEKKVLGVGINDADYNIRDSRTGWRCPYYLRWRSMLNRCYNPKYLKEHPSYDGCYVCEEWLTFSSFRRWMDAQEWEGMHLDKDLIVRGNKVYSPLTCIFIPQHVNKLFTDRSLHRGKYPLGVSYIPKSGKYVANVNEFGEQKRIGLFEKMEDAEKAYKIEKNRVILRTIEDISDEMVKTILKNRLYEDVL